mmetsp:Transcript_32251/g.59308  ORF Transcript_32251/g.59308 Transcript_32251/m.59308 type:complete len:213 (+) Transcript_32251:257-895(+)
MSQKSQDSNSSFRGVRFRGAPGTCFEALACHNPLVEQLRAHHLGEHLSNLLHLVALPDAAGALAHLLAHAAAAVADLHHHLLPFAVEHLLLFVGPSLFAFGTALPDLLADVLAPRRAVAVAVAVAVELRLGHRLGCLLSIHDDVAFAKLSIIVIVTVVVGAAEAPHLVLIAGVGVCDEGRGEKDEEEGGGAEELHGSSTDSFGGSMDGSWVD